MCLIVTGASRGIGAATARLAAKAGYAVAINYAKDREAAERIAREIIVAGGRALAIAGDVGVESDIVRLFERAEFELGPLVGLVNNAGITGGSSRVVDLAADTVAATFAVNVTGAFICAREAVKRLSTERGGNGGAIVNIGSLAARIGGGGEWVHYAASKAALETMTRGLAIEVASEGIRVNAVSPGIIATDIHATSSIPNRLEKATRAIPLGRAGDADEVASAVMWLLSPAASYVTGAILEVGGGR